MKLLAEDLYNISMYQNVVSGRPCRVSMVFYVVLSWNNDGFPMVLLLVYRDNFQLISCSLVQVLEEVRRAEFVAFDLELTGLHVTGR